MAMAVAGVAVLSAPKAAHAQGACAWWDLTCNGLANTVADSSWHPAGRDANGNAVYVRRLVDSKGNVVFEQAHRNGAGLYLVGDTHAIRRGTRSRSSTGDCKYKSNPRGYSEQCKYAKPVDESKRPRDDQREEGKGEKGGREKNNGKKH